MSRNKTFALAGGLPVVIITLAIAWLFCPGPTHRTPANFAATGPGEQRAASDPPPPQPVERAAGGALVNGQWQFGYTPDRSGTQRFLRSLPKPTLASAAPELLRDGVDQRPVLLYRALDQAYAAHTGGQQWVVGKQGIGDCVSWGWGHGCDICLAVEWKLGQSSEWRPAATEAIYGGSRVEARGASRGGYSDGSYGGAAAKFVHDWGVLFRQPYPELGFDLTTYSAQRAKSWGNFGCGGEGDKGKAADTLAKKHPVKSVALVRNFEEAAAAIAAGYPVPVCSGQGFASTRDKDGFSRASGSWSHCMCFIGVRFDRAGLLCLNSWGPNWISGPKWPADQPDGSFWVEKSTAEHMLRGQDSFAVSAYEGFPYRDLKHGDWVYTVPAGGRWGQRPLQPAESTHLALSP